MPYGFYVLYTGALFYKGVRMRCVCESIVGIHYIMARNNHYTSYNVCTFPKLWEEFNKDY